jgi:hypothetical protein
MLEELGKPNDDTVCSLMQEAAKLSPEDFKILTEALDDQRWGNIILARKLNSLGFKTSKGILFRHRSKECACAR